MARKKSTARKSYRPEKYSPELEARFLKYKQLLPKYNLKKNQNQNQNNEDENQNENSMEIEKSNNNSLSINDLLSTDIIDFIFEFLPPFPNWWCCTRVCKKWNEIFPEYVVLVVLFLAPSQPAHPLQLAWPLTTPGPRQRVAGFPWACRKNWSKPFTGLTGLLRVGSRQHRRGRTGRFRFG